MIVIYMHPGCLKEKCLLLCVLIGLVSGRGFTETHVAFMKLLRCLGINCTASLITVSLFCHIMFKAGIHVWVFFSL